MANSKKKAPGKPVKAGHDSNGRFAKGNNLGGVPFSKQDREWKAEVMAVFRKVVTHKRLEQQLERLAIKADNGNLDALKFEMEYLYGKPPQQVNLADAEGGPLAFGWMGKCPKPKK